MLGDQAQTRKSIHEMDCLAVDVILAASFDWRELANRLCAAGKKVPRASVGKVPEPFAIYRMAHAVSHADGGFAHGLTRTLNLRYQAQIRKVEEMALEALCVLMNQERTDRPQGAAGLLWALASDPRPGVEKIFRYFLHRSLTQFFSSGFRNEGEAEEIAELTHRYGGSGD